MSWLKKVKNFLKKYKTKTLNKMNNTIYLDGLKIQSVNANENIVEIEGYAAHFGKANLNNEIVNASSFDDFFDLYNANKIKPRLNYEHTDQLLGGIDGLEVKEDGLYMKAHLTKSVKIVSDTILPLIESGDLCSFSTEGYIDYNDIVEYADGTYLAKKFMLIGVSVVSVPADPQAKFSLNSFINEYKQYKEQELKDLKNNSKWFLL